MSETPIPDPIRKGLARGWKVFGGNHAALPAELHCDVAIVGTGVGAGITAELLSAAGLQAVLVEEGPLKSSRDFRQREAQAYPALYQESASRKTADKAIGIPPGRCVRGSTTVNWTSSFRTPSSARRHWREHYELPDMSDDALSPWLLQTRQRLSIGPWLVPPNTNRQRLRLGAARLGIPAAAIQRNVKACCNLGACGMGCPTNAKQSMLVTTLSTALDRGSAPLVQARAERLDIDGDRVTGLCVPAALNGQVQGGTPTHGHARHVVVAGGAINSPALLLRSKAPDPHHVLGRGTFLHPVVVSLAVFDERIEGWQGAPQTMHTDHVLEQHPVDGLTGYKLEAPPLHPVIAPSTIPGFGAEQARARKAFPNTHAPLALLALPRDGFHAEAPGGTAGPRDDGTPVLDYPLTHFVPEGARHALLSMAEIQFAAGARSATPVHELARPYRSWQQAKQATEALPIVPHLMRVLSGHVLGGCGLAGRPQLGVVRPDGRHWQVANLSVHDGSLFLTSVGANPQLSIYGIVNRLATGLARSLGGRDVRLA